MENRQGLRSPAAIEALLYVNGRPAAIGQIANFSQSGLFIETDFRRVTAYQRIEIACLRRMAPHRFPGHVVRVDDRGIGIEIRMRDSRPLKGIAALAARAQQPNGKRSKYAVLGPRTRDLI